jgi:hypothetical protein
MLQFYNLVVRVKLSLDGHLLAINSTCSCSHKHCSRTAATVIFLAFGWEDGQTRTPNKPSQSARELQQAQRRVSDWLSAFVDDVPTADLRALATTQTTAENRQEDQLLFVLEPAVESSATVLKLTYFLSRVLRNGGWSRVRKNAYFSSYELRRLPAATAEAVHLIQTLADQGSSGYGYHNNKSSSVGLEGASGTLALELIAATGRLFSLDEQGAPSQLLRLGPPRGLEWQWNEVTTPKSPEPLWALRAKLKDANEGAMLYANTPPLYVDAGAALCGVVEVQGLSAANLALLLKAPPIPQSDFGRHETTFLRRLISLPLPPAIKSIKVLNDVNPQAHLHITAVPKGETQRFGLLRAQLHFDYDGHRLSAADTNNPVLLDRATPAAAVGENSNSVPDESPRVLLHRALDAEHALLKALAQLDLINDSKSHFHLPASNTSQQRWLHWMDNDFAPLREVGCDVSVDTDLRDWITRADNLDVQLAPQYEDGLDSEGDDSQSPWFDLSLGMEVNGERHNLLPLLPDLLAQIDTRTDTGEADLTTLPPWVYLQQAGGKYLRLPTEPLRPWLQALLDLVGDGAKLGGNALRLSRFEALRMGASLGEGVAWQGAQQLQNMVQQLTGRSDLPKVAVPDGLQAELRPYQHHGLSWLQFLREHGLAGILADDMGLGKTLQTLTHLLVEKNAGRLNRPALICLPRERDEQLAA